MLKAINVDDRKEYCSWNKDNYKFITSNRNNFLCPVCRNELIFIDGDIVIKHFRHKVSCNCNWEPETENHLEMKSFMMELLNLSENHLEVNLGFAQPDLYIKERKIAIEVQNSNITKKRFLERCYNYTKNGIAVMWIFHDSMLRQGDLEQNIPLLLRTAQENNFGRIYLYSDQKLFSISFSPLKRWVEEYHDYETGDIYGGYLKEYKRKKAIRIIQELPDETYGKEIFRVRTKWIGDKPSGYLVARFYDI